MILLLGATGYIGQAFADELRRRGRRFVPLSRGAFDYTRFELLFDYVRRIRPSFLINAAGYRGSPNVDACESARSETFQANTLLPQMVDRVCGMTNTPWGQVSSGCIYSGAKVLENGQMRVVRDLNQPEVRERFKTRPEDFLGFTEDDEPNFSFRHPPCSFLGGAKALAEEALRGGPRTYLWRVRMPFDEQDSPRNLLSKLQTYRKVYDQVTSLSHLGDFVRACLNLWQSRAPFGVYNVTNPGAVTTRRVVEMIQEYLCPDRCFDFWADDEEFYENGSKTPRSSCILDSSKLSRAGVKLRPVEAALRDALERWQPARRAPRLVEPENEMLVLAK
jgi:dTDP-4-dehydrorhamnose reductase